MTTSKLKNVFFNSLGACFEYYDFIIYVFLTRYIASSFFPVKSYYAGLLLSFSIFSAGYIARPLGGLIAGHIGDRIGRRKVLICSMIIMTLSTTLIGFLPAYNTIGILAPILLTLFRVIQGLSFGAELPGITTTITDMFSVKDRGISNSILLSFVTVGLLLASLILFGIEFFLNESQIQSWGWRIPFIIGGLIGVISIFFRIKTIETLTKKNTDKHKNRNLLLLKTNLPKIIYSILFFLFPMQLPIFILYLPTLAKAANQEAVLRNISLGYVLCIVLLLLFGYISKFVHYQRIFVYSSVLFILLSPLILVINSAYNFLILIIIIQIFISAVSVCMHPIVTESFAPSFRFTGTALSYNLAYCITSFSPLVYTVLLKYYSGSILSIIVLFAVLSVISILSLLKLRGVNNKQEY